jgi:hypothetical protein
MVNWLRELDVAKEWNEVDEDATKIVGLCKVIVEKLANLNVFDDSDIEDEKERIMAEFQDLIDIECEDFLMFNDVWEELYDWADQTTRDGGKTGKVCWVKII